MVRLFVIFGALTHWGYGITIRDLVSTASWLPAYFDQLLIITDKCRNYAAFTGKPNIESISSCLQPVNPGNVQHRFSLERGVYISCTLSLDFLENSCTENNKPCLRSTAVLVSYLNATKTEETVYEVLNNTPVGNSSPGPGRPANIRNLKI